MRFSEEPTRESTPAPPAEGRGPLHSGFLRGCQTPAEGCRPLHSAC